MREAGAEDPRFSVTELQLFTRFEEPERVTPTESTADVEDGSVSVTLSPNTLLKVRLEGE
jgi:hypothetical protein